MEVDPMSAEPAANIPNSMLRLGVRAVDGQVVEKLVS
jgi:hypothetical protein